jgi:hypothetical protein
MKKLILAALLSLTACTGQLASVLDPPSAPLARTVIDDRALETAWKGLDASLDAINLVLDLKPSLIGTPAAHRVADAIDAVTLALTAAESAAAAGEATDYATALAKSKAAFVEMRSALQAMKGK